MRDSNVETSCEVAVESLCDVFTNVWPLRFGFATSWVNSCWLSCTSVLVLVTNTVLSANCTVLTQLSLCGESDIFPE